VPPDGGAGRAKLAEMEARRAITMREGMDNLLMFKNCKKREPQ
jgi:hypothetical protein